MWKMMSLILLFIVIFLSISDSSNSAQDIIAKNEDYVALLKIDGEIAEGNYEDELKKIEMDSNVKAAIIHVDSPGGTIVGSEEIYLKLDKIRKSKPIVVVMGSTAASGGYLVSLAADHIIAYNGTITGSIGVISEIPDITGLAEKLGIKFNHFKTSPLKAAPNPTEAVTEEVRAAILGTISDFYDYFIGLVMHHRKMSIEQVKMVADGRVFSGRQALKVGLIDAIGTKDDALLWLQQNKAINTNLKIREVKVLDQHEIIEQILRYIGDGTGAMIKSLIARPIAQFRS